jgi:hypothetical protein
MNPAKANYLNAFVLTISGCYGFLTMPVGVHGKALLGLTAIAGVMLLLMGIVWKKSPRLMAQATAVLTFIVLFFTSSRFIRITEWNTPKFLLLLCILSNILALFIFINNFFMARIQNK